MSNDSEKGFLRSENSQLSSEVERQRQENDFLRSQLAHSATTAQNGGVMARMARERIRELEAQLAEAQTIISQKNELIAQWYADSKGMKVLAQALRDEGRNHPDAENHPIAHSQKLQSEIYTKAKQQALTEKQ